MTDTMHDNEPEAPLETSNLSDTLGDIPSAFEGLPEEPGFRILEDDYREYGPLPAVAELYTALARAQASFEVIVMNKTAKIQSAKGSYQFGFADLKTVLAATRKHLNREGVFLTQPASQVSPGVVVLRTTLARGAAKLQLTTRFGYEGDIKAFGGTISYHRRYHLNSTLGVSADADADDGPSENEIAGSSGPRQAMRPPAHPTPSQSSAGPAKAPSARADRVSERPPGLGAGPVTEAQKATISAEVRRLQWQGPMVTAECRRVTGGSTTELDEVKAATFITHLMAQWAGS